jgi:peptidoglycan/xylan/chitin deacetylase (PgdA/CDA1 family)
MAAQERPAAIRWAASALYHTGLLRPLALAAGYANRKVAFQILTYHRVNDDGDPFFPSVPTGVFERRMAYIARNFPVLAVEELVARIRLGGLPKNALAITFDDGYRDNLTHAAPILARYGLPATIFLATGFIGTAEVPWFDRLALAFKATRVLSFVAPWGQVVSLAKQADRLQALEQMLKYLRLVPEDDFRRAFDGTLQVLGVADRRSVGKPMLAWDDVRALVNMGFSIGAHTVNHPILSRLTPDRARQEVVDSRRMVETSCGRSPVAFAYPSGRPEDYTETVKRLVREAGFTCAVTTQFGVNTQETCAYELRRGGPWEEHLPTYALKLAWYRHAER